MVGHRQAAQGRLVGWVRLLPRHQRLSAREAPLRRFHPAARGRQTTHRGRIFAQCLHGQRKSTAIPILNQHRATIPDVPNVICRSKL